jgi:hypothetical protein
MFNQTQFTNCWQLLVFVTLIWTSIFFLDFVFKQILQIKKSQSEKVKRWFTRNQQRSATSNWLLYRPEGKPIRKNYIPAISESIEIHFNGISLPSLAHINIENIQMWPRNAPITILCYLPQRDG